MGKGRRAAGDLDGLPVGACVVVSSMGTIKGRQKGC